MFEVSGSAEAGTGAGGGTDAARESVALLRMDRMLCIAALPASLETECPTEVVTPSEESGGRGETAWPEDVVVLAGECGQRRAMSNAGCEMRSHCAATWPGTEEWRDISRLFAFMMVAGLAAAVPRGLALAIISRVVPYAPLPEALDDFKSMWAPCADPANIFPAYSPGGQLFRWLVITDHFFCGIGLTMGFWGVLVVLCSLRGCGSKTINAVSIAVCRLASVLALLNLSRLMAGDLWHSRLVPEEGEVDSAMTKEDLWAIYTALTVFFESLAYLLIGTIAVVGCLRYTPSLGGPWSVTCRIVWERARLPLTLSVVIAANVCFLLFFLHTQAVQGFLQGASMTHAAIVIVVESTSARVLTLLLRVALLANFRAADGAAVHLVNMMTFLVESSTSWHIRMNGWLVSDSELLNTAMTSLLKAMAGLASFAVVRVFSVLRCHRMHFSSINGKTLDGILDSYDSYQRHMHIFYGHILTEELSEVSVCILLAVYELLAPPWTHYGTWASLASMHGARCWVILGQLALRLSFQILAGYGILRSCFRSLPIDRRAIFRNAFCSTGALCFYYGVTMFHTLSFWPKVVCVRASSL
jgi:hypothetical protein